MFKLSYFLALAKNNNPVEPLKILQDNIFTSDEIFEGVESNFLTVNISSDVGPDIYSLFFFRAKNDLPNTYTSTAEDGSWDIWGVHTLAVNYYENDTSRGTRCFRQLRRLRRSDENRAGETRTLLGPWSAKSFERKVEWLSDSIVYPQVPDEVDEKGFPLTWKRDPNASIYFPHLMDEDASGYLAQIDYDPTDEEIDNDVEADLFNIFGF